jgi:hypothetical protein
MITTTAMEILLGEIERDNIVTREKAFSNGKKRAVGCLSRRQEVVRWMYGMKKAEIS